MSLAQGSTAQRVAYVARRTVFTFLDRRALDLAASLTYYSVLALFPAIVALSALLGVVGHSEDSVDLVLEVLRPVVSGETLRTVEGPVRGLAESPLAGPALAVGLAGALWSASAYVNAFSRAMNTIHDVEEGRPFWELRPVMLLVTVVSLVLVAIATVLLLVSGRLARSLGDAVGLGDTAVRVWTIVQWPGVAAAAMVLIGMLYRVTPNVQRPRLRWISSGALVALGTWLLASFGLSVYVSNFASYDRTYGSLAGVVIGLLFLWVSNVALLVGALLDVEVQRVKQLDRGLPAEEWLQLPLRDTRKIERTRERYAALVDEARAWREEAASHPRDEAGSDPT